MRRYPPLTIEAVLTPDEVRALLKPFGVFLDDLQINQLLTYLALLLKWNQKINLTAIRDERERVTRHFGESLMLAGAFDLRGRLLDIGSGAGFPGLALKIAAPQLDVTLLEPVGKRRAFLHEIVRACEMDRVDVRAERLQEYQANALFDAITMRAVGDLEEIAGKLPDLLAPEGRFYLWSTSIEDGAAVALRGKLRLDRQKAIPGSERRTISAWVKVAQPALKQ